VSDELPLFKVGDLVRFAERADKYKAPIHWTGNDSTGAIVSIPELTPAVITAIHQDEEGNYTFDVLVMNKIIPGWYDTSFEEYWDDLEKERLCTPES
jgi:hypothetical protein